MTRTRITAADGTRYIPEARRTRRIRRTLLGGAAIIALPFMIAAALGIAQGIDQEINNRPTAPIKVEKAIKACDRAPEPARADCIGLYLRPAYTIGGSYTPAGAKIVEGECFADTALTRGELIDCLRRPI